MKTWWRAYLASQFPSCDRALRAAAHAPVWVCWRYDPQEWLAFDKAAGERSARRVHLTILWGLLLVVSLGLGSAAAFLNPQSGLLGAAFVLGATGCAAAVAYIIVWRAYCDGRDAHQARRKGPHEIRIGPLAVFLPGEVFALLAYSAFEQKDLPDTLVGGLDVLENVEVLQESTQLIFTGRRVRGRGTLGRRITVAAPVPKDSPGAAQELARRFREEILTAADGD